MFLSNYLLVNDAKVWGTLKDMTSTAYTYCINANVGTPSVRPEASSVIITLLLFHRFMV